MSADGRMWDQSRTAVRVNLVRAHAPSGGPVQRIVQQFINVGLAHKSLIGDTVDRSAAIPANVKPVNFVFTV